MFWLGLIEPPRQETHNIDYKLSISQSKEDFVISVSTTDDKPKMLATRSNFIQAVPSIVKSYTLQYWN